MSGKLTNVEKFAIQGMVMADKPVAEIASTLGRSVQSVTSYLDKLAASIQLLKDNNVPTTDVAPQAQPEPEPQPEYIPELERKAEEEKKKPPSVVPGNLVKRLMGNKTAGKGAEGPSIMTPAAAAVSDDAVKYLQTKPVRSRTSKGGIYHIDTGEVS
jgi:hypothetical protein